MFVEPNRTGLRFSRVVMPHPISKVVRRSGNGQVEEVFNPRALNGYYFRPAAMMGV